MTAEATGARRTTAAGTGPGRQPYPIALDLAGRRCVVVGGGAVAERKARGLLAAGAAVTVIAPELTPGLRALASAGTITGETRPFAPGDLAGAVLVFAATDRREVNAAVAAAARAAGALVNVADAPDEGDFSVPALLRRGRLTVGVSTAGGSPVVAGLVRDRLAAALDDGYAALLDLVAALREELRADGRRMPADTWRAALTPEALALAAAGRLEEAEQALRAALAERRTSGATNDERHEEGTSVTVAGSAVPAAPGRRARMSETTGVLRIGTRGSALALRQAEMVVDALRAAHPGLDPQLVVFKPLGDRDKTRPLSELGGQGVFVREIEQALTAGEIDIAVHSLKDLSGHLPDGLTLGAVTRREDPRDVLISRHGLRLAELPPGAAVGTSSPRRAAQVRALRPDLRVLDLRGNIDTRLRKAEAAPYDGVILAAAGLERMGWQDRVTEWFAPDRFLPMVGQGARAIEARADDTATLALLAPLDDRATRLATSAERAYLRRLGAGCRAALAAYATLDGDRLRLHALLADPRDPAGLALLRDAAEGPVTTVAEAETVGERLAETLLARGHGMVRDVGAAESAG